MGWRATVKNERLGYYYFWRAIGARMGITNIPESYEAFEEWSRRYERERFTFAETNRRVGSSTRDLFASWFPMIFTPILRYSIYAMLDDVMLTSFGFPQPLPLTRPALRATLKLRSFFAGWLPPLGEPHFFTDDRNRTHPNGYEISKLGPPKLVAAEAKRTKIESR
jgi:hypothetical protein